MPEAPLLCRNRAIRGMLPSIVFATLVALLKLGASGAVCLNVCSIRYSIECTWARTPRQGYPPDGRRLDAKVAMHLKGGVREK